MFFVSCILTPGSSHYALLATDYGPRTRGTSCPMPFQIRNPKLPNCPLLAAICLLPSDT
jgi:hypothetical protein